MRGIETDYNLFITYSVLCLNVASILLTGQLHTFQNVVPSQKVKFNLPLKKKFEVISK